MRGSDHFNSPSEVDFLQLVADAGLPRPEVNTPLWIGGRWYVADFLWRLLGLIAEVDDPSHDRPLARQRDAVRDRHLTEAGFGVAHFDTRDLKRAPVQEMARLRAVIDQCRRASSRVEGG